jgi:hypothetical protein
MTTSSAFLDWLWFCVSSVSAKKQRASYMVLRDDPGFRCRMMEPMRSTAIVLVCAGGKERERRGGDEGRKFVEGSKIC